MLNLPAATRNLILANIAVFVLQVLTGHVYDLLLALWSIGPNFHLWQVVTYAFLHGSITHIFFNMFALFMFGPAIEQYWGSRRFLVLYFASLLSAAGIQLLTSYLSGTQEPTIGASGGIFGVLLAFAYYFPRQRLILLPIPIPLPAWLFVTLYGVLELVLGVTGTESGVAHFAHLGGMAGAALVILYWQTHDRTLRPPW